MSKVNEIVIDGYSVYIENLEQLDKNQNTHDSIRQKKEKIEWTIQDIEQTLKPIISIFDSFRNAVKDATPNEMEFSMQFDISLKGETPVLKIVSAETSAQIAVKFVWKNGK